MSIAVSVIVPVYKTPLNYLKECLDSLTAQTLQETEFILIFDGEDNALFKECEEYKTNDKRFQLFIQPHLGVSATRNYGIEQAHGEYITFVDADDWIDKDCCKKTYNFALQNNSDVVLFDYTEITELTKKQTHLKNDSCCILHEIERNELLKQCIALQEKKFTPAVSTWCKLIKKEYLIQKKIFFPISCKIAVDRPFAFKIFECSSNISYLRANLYCYYATRPNSILNTFNSDTLATHLNYLIEIKKISSDYNKLIANQSLKIFFASWSSCYLNKNNKNSLYISLKKLRKHIQSSTFKNLIKDADFKSFPLIIRIESFLFCKNLVFPIYLHALKYFISKTFNHF